MNNYKLNQTIDTYEECSEAIFGDMTTVDYAELEGLRRRAKTRGEGVMSTAKYSVRPWQGHFGEKAKDAWDRFEEAVRLRKEEAERLHDVQQLNDGGDLDPVVPSGVWFDESHRAHR